MSTKDKSYATKYTFLLIFPMISLGALLFLTMVMVVYDLILFFIFLIIWIVLFIYDLKYTIFASKLIQEHEYFQSIKLVGLHFAILAYDKYNIQMNKEINSIKFLNSAKEKKILRSNIISLKMFEKSKNYKYIMIAMGSILEFLLIKYCTVHNIPPADFKAPNGKLIRAGKKYYVNYVQSAINNDFFNQKRKWKLVQSYLRDFRNYVHIKKECNEEKIDEAWYKVMGPMFKSIFNSFKSESS